MQKRVYSQIYHRNNYDPFSEESTYTIFRGFRMKNKKWFLNLIDIGIFSTLLYLALLHYADDHKMYAIIAVISILYISLRKPDVNTLTLAPILIVSEASPIVIIPSPETITSYQLHGTFLLIYILTAIGILLRSFLLPKYAPKFIANNKNLTITHQDMVMGALFLMQVIWQFAQLLEHFIRHIDDIGLGGLFGNWVPMFFYDIYKTGQFFFSVITLVILYFMTFDLSKRERKTNQTL